MNEKETQALVAAILSLQARVDAQQAALVLLGRRTGLDLAALMEEVRRNAHQARLERIEDQAPGLSAQVDLRAISDMDVDPEILDQLRWDDGYRPDREDHS